VVIGAGAFAWEYTTVLERDKEIAGMKLAGAKAQIDQTAADMKSSLQILTEQAQKLAANNATATSALQQVTNALPSSTCGPSVRDAARVLRTWNSGGAGPTKPGPQPPAPVR
jgi:hypothetical protein